jgi:SET domain-containing protein
VPSNHSALLQTRNWIAHTSQESKHPQSILQYLNFSALFVKCGKHIQRYHDLKYLCCSKLRAGLLTFGVKHKFEENTRVAFEAHEALKSQM